MCIESGANMKIDWKELNAVKIAEPYLQVLFPITEAEDAAQLKANMEKYTMLPDDVQRALGYMRCLLESETFENYSTYGKYSMDILRHNIGHVPQMRYPLQFVGWGGKYNNIGLAYQIDGKCHIEPNSKIFYTDDDIHRRADVAEELASYIAEESSGISDVCVEKLDQLRTMAHDIRTEHWCVTFHLGDTARKEVVVNGNTIKPDDGEALFIFPRQENLIASLAKL